MSQTDPIEDQILDLTEPLDVPASLGRLQGPLVEELLVMQREVARLGALLMESQEEIGRLRVELDLFSNTDLLTGFVNSNGLLEAIELGTDRFKRAGEPLTVLAIRLPELVAAAPLDPDDHVQAVQHLGALIKAGLRRLDRVGRLEDDSFVTVLANLGSDDLDIVLGRIRTALTGAPVQIGLDETDLHPIISALVVESDDMVPDADALLARCLDGLAAEAGVERRAII